MQTVDVVHDSALPAERVYAYLAEHENLGPLLGARVRRLRDGDASRNGAGSARELRLAVLPPIVETVTAEEPGRWLEYRITQGSPLRGHRGRIEVTPRGSGCRVRWTITFGTVVPLLDVLVRLVLQPRLAAGLRTVDRRA